MLSRFIFTPILSFLLLLRRVYGEKKTVCSLIHHSKEIPMLRIDISHIKSRSSKHEAIMFYSGIAAMGIYKGYQVFTGYRARKAQEQQSVIPAKSVPVFKAATQEKRYFYVKSGDTHANFMLDGEHIFRREPDCTWTYIASDEYLPAKGFAHWISENADIDAVTVTEISLEEIGKERNKIKLF